MQKLLKEEIKQLESKLERNANSLLFARLADAYLQTDRIDEAIELCERGIKKHPYYVTGHYVLGKCYLRKKLFDQAEKELKRVLLFDPKYIAAHRDYGELMAQIGWANTCEMSYEEIIRIDPFNDRAKERLKALKEQTVLTTQDRSKEETNLDLEEVEKHILNEVTPPFHEERTFPKEIPEPISMTPPGSKEIFKETDGFFEEDKANLDLLEDIFRDEEIPDLSLKEDFTNIEPAASSTIKTESNVNDKNYFLDNESETEEIQHIEKEDLEGLDIDDVFAVTDEGNQVDKPDRDISFSMRQPKSQKKVEPIPGLTKDITVKKPKAEESLPASEEDLISDMEAAERKKEKIVTPTLGEIYAAQRQYTKAIGVYEILKKKDPNNAFYRQKIEYLQKKLEESQAD